MKKFSYKILFIFAFCFLLLLLNNSDVFGYTASVMIDDNITVNIKEIWSTYEVFKKASYFSLVNIPNYDYPLLYYSDQPFIFRDLTDNDDTSVFKTPVIVEFETVPTFFELCRFQNFSYDEESSAYSVPGYYGSSYAIDFIESHNGCIPLNEISSDSSLDNISRVGGNSGFPLPLREVLAPIVRETPLKEANQEILEILPIVIVIIVGLIGLRKGLQLLLTVLHRS